MSAPGLTAVVLGGTGATGEALVNQLVQHPRFKEVVTVGRRIVEVIPPEDKRTAELRQVKVDMDALESEAKEAVTKADVLFCALGTTRKTAGSAAAFKKVDFEYVAAGARLARAAGIPHFSLVSASGANHKCPANDFGLFHGLLYTKTKGMAEQAVLQQGFKRVSIFRPGLLNRGDKARSGEKAFLGIVSNIHVKDVARLMILDALRDPSTARPVMFFSMGALMKAAKQENEAPEAST